MKYRLKKKNKQILEILFITILKNYLILQKLNVKKSEILY